MFKTTLSVALFILLAACGRSEPTPTTGATSTSAPPTVETTPTESAASEVEVQQGTNMAAAVSPDGSRIVSSIQGTLFSMNAGGGDAQAITDYYFDAREPNWSSDGSSIVFQGYRDGTWDLWQIDADGSNPIALTDDAFDDREPAYSPVNDSIVFSSDRSGNYDLWLLQSGNLRQLSSEDGNAHSPAWSSDGSQIAYAVDGAGFSSEIRVLNVADGQSESVLSEAGVVAGLSWRPDDGALSYQLRSLAGATLKLVDLQSAQDETISADGADVFPFRANWTSSNTLVYTASGEIRQLILDEAETVIPFSARFRLDREPYERRVRNYDSSERRALGITTPSISNDGEWVAFTALADLWLMNVSSGELTQLTDDSFAEQRPVFSADGNSIAYLSDKSGSPLVWIYDRTSGQSVRLAGDLALSNLSWSPDGTQLAGFLPIPRNPLGGQITSVNIATGELRSHFQPMQPQAVSWSADGQQLVTTRLNTFSTRFREGVYTLLAIDIDSGEITQMTPTPHRSMISLVLDADGETFTYVQGAQLWRARLDGSGQPVRLTTRLTDDPAFSANGEYAVFMSGDKLVRLTASNGEQQELALDLSYAKTMPAEQWVLRVGRLFDGVNNNYQEDVDIVIAGNRIQSIEAQQDRDLTVVDMSDKTVIPGLFEMHAHLGTISESQGRSWLSFGITSVRDPGAHPYAAKERQEAWDSGRMIGPRTHTTGYLADGNRVYYSIAEGLVSVEHVERAMERARLLELDFIKTYVRLPDEWQKIVVDAAHEMGIPTSSHEIFPAVSHGMDHVEHFGGTSRRGYQPKISSTGFIYNDVINLLSESQMGITPTLVLSGFSLVTSEDEDLLASPQVQSFYGPDFRGRSPGPTTAATVSANGEALRKMIDAGALVVTGTDAPLIPNGVGLHAELRLFERAGLSPFETLRAATFSSATAAGVIADTGTLEVGKLADIVVIDGDPLADVKDVDNIVMTVKNGRAYALEELLN